MTDIFDTPDLSLSPYPEDHDVDIDQQELGTIIGDTLAVADVPPGTRAIIYIRVSSHGQVNTDYDPEGNSLPAQRKSCQRKAEQLGLTIIDEYVEPGKSATEMTKRIAFRQMLARIHTERDVDYVIVYKLSRMARNRYDEALVGVDLKKRGVTLISATEAIDETPVGQLMQGMLAVFNEYRSKEDGADIAYKMGEKAKRGGTLGRAKLGYLNIIDRFEGREVRTIEVDKERAPFVKLAFELYATGDYTLHDIVDELTDRGLVTRPTARQAAGPVSVAKIHRLLQDRYYLGVISYKGEEYPGRHEALLDEALFDTVQGLIRSRGHSGERRRRNNHYLKGSVFCGVCYRKYGIDRRLVIQRSVGRHGGEYFYFYCPGTKDGTCKSPHHNLFRVEDAVERHYKTKRFGRDFLDAMRELMTTTLGDQYEAQALLKKQLDDQLVGLDIKEENLLDLAADGTVPQARIKARLVQIQKERERLEGQLSAVQIDLSAGARFIEANLALLQDPHALYKNASEEIRRRLNQTIYSALYIEREEVSGGHVMEPLDYLSAAESAYRATMLGLDRRAVERQYDAAFAENHAPTRGKAALAGGLAFQQPETATFAYLFTGPSTDGVSYKRSMVEMGGIEPPSTAVILRLLRA